MATEAGILFLDYLFLSSIPLNKVSADVYAYNDISLRMAKKGGFQVEGVLRQERYWGGEYHDIIRVSLLRSEWLAARERLGADRVYAPRVPPGEGAPAAPNPEPDQGRG